MTRQGVTKVCKALRLGVMLAAIVPVVAEARLTRLLVSSNRLVEPAVQGAPQYRILRGTYEGEVDPADPHNSIITDLEKADRQADGRVRYRASFAIAMPADPARASGFLWYEVPNRGVGAVARDPDGHIRVISGWQGDIAPGEAVQWLEAPSASGPNGKPLTGPVLQRFTDVLAGRKSIAITGGIGRPTPRPLPVTLDTRQATLFRQASDDGPRIAIAARDWAFADCGTMPFPGRPDGTQLCLREGFDATQAYVLVYQGKEPKVLGIGFAAVRDLNTFLRSAAADDAGTPNPVAGMVRWPIVAGTSQSGNFVRSFISLGFNAGEDGKRVFDGANANIAARHVPLNIRFGLPGGAAALYDLGSEGALWWSPYRDRARGRGTASLLDRCLASGTCPKIVETFGSAEIWGLRMSPNLVGTDARADIALPPQVRRYYFPGVSHGGSYSSGFPVKGDPPIPGTPRCVLPWNPNPIAQTRRAILQSLADWVSRDKEPLPSRYPTLANGDLVAPTAAAMGWPRLAGKPIPDGKLMPMLDYDVGPGFNYRDVSGVVTRQPPTIRRTLPSLVPRVNADGNETSGIPSVALLVPLGTYTGWNELASGYGKGGQCGFIGGFIPFARTEAERRAAGDHRPSLEERYGDHAGFVARVEKAAADQVAQGWLLPDDAQRLISLARASSVLQDPAK